MLKHIFLISLLLAITLAREYHHVKRSSSSSEAESEEYEKGEEPKTKYVCDEDVMHIRCKRGYLIHILWANYGRTCEDYCDDRNDGDTKNTNCTNPNTSGKVGRKCNNKERCEICANVDSFGDQCPGTSKYLEVIYQCLRIRKCYPKYEKFVVCRSKCRETCDSAAGNMTECGTEPGCECLDGNVWDDRSQRCICKDMCPWRDVRYPKCRTHEHFESCATLCPRTCEDRWPQKPCPLGCKPGYVCDDGYIRDTITNRCIRECDCPCCTQAPPSTPAPSSSSSSSSSDETRSYSSSSSSEECDTTKGGEGTTPGGTTTSGRTTTTSGQTTTTSGRTTTTSGKTTTTSGKTTTTSGKTTTSSGGATSSGAESGGVTSKGTTSSGATSKGVTSGGATSKGATSSGATSSGATSDGATSGGVTSGGVTSGGATSGGETTVGTTTGGEEPVPW